MKRSKIPDTFTAPGLKEAREVLAEMNMSASERRTYNAFNKRLHDIASANFTKEADLNFAIEEAREEGMEKGREKGMEKTKKEITLNLIKAGLDNDTISKITSLTTEEIQKLRNEKKKQKPKQETLKVIFSDFYRTWIQALFNPALSSFKIICEDSYPHTPLS